MDGLAPNQFFQRIAPRNAASQITRRIGLVLSPLVFSVTAISTAPAQTVSPLPAPRLLEVTRDVVPIGSVADRPSLSASLVRPQARVIACDQSRYVATLTANRTGVVPVAGVGSPEHGQTSSENGLGSSEHGLGQTDGISVDQALQTRGSVTFRKTPMSEVVFLLSDLWHINIVAGEAISGEVTGSFHDAPLREVLAAVLTSSGYSYRKTGSSLVVLSADQIGSDDPSFVSRTLRIPGGQGEDDSIIEAASMLLSQRGQIKKIGTDSVLVIDNEERIDRVASLFEGLSPATPVSAARSPEQEQSIAPEVPAAGEVRSGIAYFTPQYTEAEEMAESLQAALGETVIVAVYAAENRIMVKGTPDELRLAGEAVAQLDRPRAQVRITAMIYDVALTEVERLGVNWNRSLLNVGGAEGEVTEITNFVSDFFAASADLTDSGITSIGLRTLTETMDAGVFLEALDSNSEAKLLADPSITVGDRRQASIRIVRKIPIVGANPVEGSNAVFTQTEFEEAGVILKVKPRISRDGTIELNVQPEYSVVAEITTTGPVIDSRTAETIVRVADGQMFVLGGLRQTSIVESQRGVPYLRDMKYVGNLFRSHATEVRESELIVFLKPEIITPYYDGYLREQRAACVANTQLDEIPYATTCPMQPCCKDPYCPNHHRRPRINGGSRELEMLGGEGFQVFPIHESEIPLGGNVVPGQTYDVMPGQTAAPARSPNLAPNHHPVIVDQNAADVFPAPASRQPSSHQRSIHQPSGPLELHTTPIQ